MVDILITDGSIHYGDTLISTECIGRVKGIRDHLNNSVKSGKAGDIIQVIGILTVN